MHDIVAEYKNGIRDFAGADLTGADLTGAYLAGADLARADLAGANLAGANLARANLAGADLTGANLTRAYLAGANLTGAYLARANLTGADLPHFQICPEVGAFVAFKKLHNDSIAELVIPADAPRTSSLIGRKCRAMWVEVTALYDTDGNALPRETVGIGRYDKTRYIAGERVEADGWDDDIRVECTHGIHFFATLREAREYA